MSPTMPKSCPLEAEDSCAAISATASRWVIEVAAFMTRTRRARSWPEWRSEPAFVIPSVEFRIGAGFAHAHILRIPRTDCKHIYRMPYLFFGIQGIRLEA